MEHTDGRSGKGRNEKGKSEKSRSEKNRSEKSRNSYETYGKDRRGNDGCKNGKYKKGEYKNNEYKSNEYKNGKYKNNEYKNGASSLKNADKRKTGGEKFTNGHRETAEQRAAFACPVQKRCGGCQLLHLSYQKQLARKQQQVEKLLKPYCRVHKITGMEQPLHYRNKVHAVFSRRKGGTIVSGIYAEGTHDVIPVEQCLLENQKADEIIGTIRELLKSFKIKIYDEDTEYGLFRHVLIRTARQTGQIMVVLVLSSPILPAKNHFVKALLQAHPEITTIVLNVNERRTSMVLGDRETVLYGKGYIEDVLGGCRFRISAKSFYQINSVQTEALYAKAMEAACLTGRERVIDAYCGIGTIGLIAARQAREVIGVELNADAVRDAVRNAKMNEIRNAVFYQNDAGRFLTGMAQQGEKADVVFLDPPRSGSDEAFLSSVVQLAPRRVVYISCNPETQARDLEYLTRHGYRADGAWPYDMFPFTEHTEVIVSLAAESVNIR